MSYFSHQNSTFLIAKKLEQAHCDVFYCGPSESAEGDNMVLNVTKQGFRYIDLDPRDKSYYSSHFLRSKNHENTQSMFLSLLYNLQDGRLYNTFIKKHRPDLLILDIHYTALIIPFNYYGVPVVVASTKIGLDKDYGVPPLNSSVIPDRNLMNIAMIEKAWQKELDQKRRFNKYFDFLEDIAEKYEFDFHHYFYQEKAIVPFGFHFPELIFWDLEFDFLRTESGLKNKYYLGNQIDVDRKEDAIPIDGEHIIYVSLGSRLNNLTDHKLTLLKEILKAAKGLLNFEFVIATSTFKNELRSMVASPNITLLEYAPQISLLSKSLLMITHAGGNSVKECIRMGVPMLCYPFEHDQFGNAARVVYHRVGLRGVSTEDKADDIRQKISTIIQSKKIKKQIKKFQRRSIEAQENYNDVEVIKQFLIH